MDQDTRHSESGDNNCDPKEPDIFPGSRNIYQAMDGRGFEETFNLFHIYWLKYENNPHG